MTNRIRRWSSSVSVGALLFVFLSAPPSSYARPSRDQPDARTVEDYQRQFGVTRDESERRLKAQSKGFDLVDAAQRRLGSSYAGLWFDNEQGRFKIAVTDRAALPEADGLVSDRNLQGESDTVLARSSWAELEEAQGKLNDALRDLLLQRKVKTALEASSNAVLIDVSTEADRATWDRVRSEAAKSNVNTRVQETLARTFDLDAKACSYPHCTRPLRGGVEIYGTALGIICSAGLLAVTTTNTYFLTSGHCFGQTWQAYDPSYGWRTIGPTAAVYNDAWDDVQAIRATGSHWDIIGWQPMVAAWTVSEEYPVWGKGWSWQGLFGCRLGRTSPIQCGTVLAVNSTEQYDGILRYRMTRTNACQYSGDSGGPWISNYYAYGLVAAGNGCGPGQAMVYEEVGYAEQRTGVRVVTAG